MNIAVIGAGISGLACAWQLARAPGLRVSLLEADARLGGHTHTVEATVDGITHPVDTGFLVFNHRTYPNLVRLFDELGVPTAKSEMTFSVSLRDAGGVPTLEWAGTNLVTLFAQSRNLARPAFWRMAQEIVRFNREASALAGQHGEAASASQSLGDYLDQNRYSQTFRDWYLLPMGAAIWSCPTAEMLAFPVATFTRFCLNHGLLQVADRPQWMTVAGGARQYVEKLADAIRTQPGCAVRTSAGVTRVSRAAAGVNLVTARGIEHFDQVVFACHSDQALALLEAPTSVERSVLAAVPYQTNHAVLHTDIAQLPARRRAWAAWNFLGNSGKPGAIGNSKRPVAVTYLLNKLQPLPFSTPLMVTLNPLTSPRTETILQSIEYAHPVFNAAAIAAQARVPQIQGADRLWFAGAWTGYGFHEDGLKSGLHVAHAIAALANSLSEPRLKNAA